MTEPHLAFASTAAVNREEAHTAEFCATRDAVESAVTFIEGVEDGGEKEMQLRKTHGSLGQRPRGGQDASVEHVDKPLT